MRQNVITTKRVACSICNSS